MSYFSIEFALLLLAFFMLYWAWGKAYQIQNLLLLAFNYLIVCLFSPYFAIVLFIFTCLVYFLALVIDTARVLFVFICCVLVVVLYLCFFKYYALIKDEFDALLAFMGFSLSADIVFPLGLSFYTFASITYLRAVYEGAQSEVDDTHYEEGNPAFEGFFALATYLSFFPTLLAGPIMRSHFFFEQYHKVRTFGHIDQIIVLVLFGVAKKALIANYLEIYSSPILKNPAEHHILELITGICAYSVQLYCDFSGYVNLVCAFALMLGFVLPPNFNMPYMAKNLKDFWSRWHISLSTFIRDFIYIPLGGNRKGFLNAQLFVLIAFTLSGLWHGNTLNFMLWGILHGLGLITLNCLRKIDFSLESVPFLGSFITFIFVTFCWIFFYYPSFDEAMEFFSACANGLNADFSYQDWLILACFLVVFMIYPFMSGFMDLCIKVSSCIHWTIKPFVLAAIFTLLVGMMPQGIPNFIYAGF